jgi:sugar/nucleoside kinase (ribokinase family)
MNCYQVLIWILFFCQLGIVKADANQYKVLGIGAPCIDVLVKADFDIIQSLGIKGGSTQIDQMFIPNLLTKLNEAKLILAPGGSSSNTIKGLANLGHSCAFYGKRGNDKFGQQFVQSIKELGITSLVTTSKTHSTQLCLCLISPDGDRTMRCYPGAANEISSKDITPDLFEGVTLVHIEGYALYMNDPQFTQTVMQMAKANGARISFDLSSFEMVNMFKPLILHLLRNYIDIVFANADEVKALTGLDPYEGCKNLKNHCDIAVVMVGKEGCYVGSKDHIIQSPASEVNVIDTTGAGDLFVSGFLHGILKDLPLETCAQYGNLTGAAVVGVYGAEISATKWDEIKKFNPNQISFIESN